MPEDMTQFVGLVWCVDGELERSFDGETAALRAGWVSIVMPGTLMLYSVVSETAEIRFFAVDGVDATKRVAEVGLWEGEFPAGPPPVGWLQHLHDRLASAGWDGDDVASSAAYDLLVRLGDSVRRLSGDKLVYEARRILHEQWRDPKLNVARIVKQLMIDRSTLARRFPKVTGCGVLEYLARLRFREAKRLLTTTALPIAEIGQRVGYPDPAYFSRTFTKHVGRSPRLFRLDPLAGGSAGSPGR